MPQGREIFPQLTVEENLRIGLSARRDKARTIPQRVFDLFPVLKQMAGRQGTPSVHLTPHEQEKLLIYVAALLARERRARGLKLNYPESVALITAAILEGARDGKSVAELMSYGATILTRADKPEYAQNGVTHRTGRTRSGLAITHQT